MIRLLPVGRKVLLAGVAFGLALFALEGREVKAGPLTLIVTEAGGGGAIPIDDNGGLDNDPTVGVINVNTSLLNLSLVNFTFTDLEANSNSPGTSAVSALSQTGTVQLLAGAGSGSISVVATDNDYGTPSGTGALHSSASNTYTHADNGNSTAFTSWFNPSNALGAMDIASPTVTLIALAPPDPNSHSGDAAATAITAIPLYGLTNSMEISLSGGAVGAQSQDQFTGSTTLTASAVPEPASAVLMLTAMPVAVLGLMRSRRARA